MKRTRRSLEVLIDSIIGDDSCMKYQHVQNVADKLIQEGWVKVETPREWVMCPRCWNDPSPWEKWHKLPMMCEICKSNVIHVREVLPTDPKKSLDEMYDYAETLVKEPKEPSPEEKALKRLESVLKYSMSGNSSSLLNVLIEYFSAKVEE